MSIQKISIALASILVMAAGVPAFANTINTSGTAQDNRQTNIVSGDRSSGVNISRQDARTSQSGRNTDNQSATVQGSDQFGNISGDRSRSVNVSVQSGVTTQRQRP
jgi:hypothetical protein